MDGGGGGGGGECEYNGDMKDGKVAMPVTVSQEVSKPGSQYVT